MEQIALHINRGVFQRASLYAKIKNFPISKEVKSLAGHLHIDGNAMDWDKEREHYLADKYGFII